MIKKITKKEIARRLRILNTKRLKEWSIAVRARDGNVCSYCFADKYVHAHHLFPKEIKEFKFDIDNGIALCAKHHKYDNLFAPHKNALAFVYWMTQNRSQQLRTIQTKYNNYLIENSQDIVVRGSN